MTNSEKKRIIGLYNNLHICATRVEAYVSEEIMRMRKLSLVLLLVLIITMIFGMVACDHAGGGNVDNPVIPTPTPDDDDEPSNVGILPSYGQ